MFYRYGNTRKRDITLPIRPEAIKIFEQKSDGKNIFIGKIEEVEFFGSVINLSVNVAGLPLISKPYGIRFIYLLKRTCKCTHWYSSRVYL
ncbi:TOBE domain-containing protein [Neobacillus vireti]|uniref:TOBE domain-containing protein n=1 Tax=Neobacillus vireti TaxID=220686 RepID=UPI0038B2D8F6